MNVPYKNGNYGWVFEVFAKTAYYNLLIKTILLPTTKLYTNFNKITSSISFTFPPEFSTHSHSDPPPNPAANTKSECYRQVILLWAASWLVRGVILECINNGRSININLSGTMEEEQS